MSDARYGDAVLLEVDRRAAITHAIGVAETGDVVVIAGKGHETTQTIGDDVAMRSTIASSHVKRSPSVPPNTVESDASESDEENVEGPA